MADSRRRRRIRSSEDSEELSEESVEELEIGKVSEAESIEEAKETTVVDSEYESAEEEEETGKEKEEGFEEIIKQEKEDEIQENSVTPESVLEEKSKIDENEIEAKDKIQEKDELVSDKSEVTADSEISEPVEPQMQNGEAELDLNPVDEEGGVEEIAEDTIIEGDCIEGDDDDDEDDELGEDNETDDEDKVIEDENDWKEGEREQGDGQESQTSAKDKVLDDDEDKRNPQYIPKKGGFYEHDDRLFDNEEKEEEKKPKKKLWKDEGKWAHDRFKEDEQHPKSRDELLTIYGYDIRNEDGPPRARRRRRYGRGPNKYTRKWEDEDAYGKISPRRGACVGDFVRGRGSRGFVPRGRGQGFGGHGQGFGGQGRGSYNNNRGSYNNNRDEFRRPPWQNQDCRPRLLSSGSARELDVVESRTILPSSTASPSAVSVQPVSESASSTSTTSTTSITFTNSKQSSVRIDPEVAECQDDVMPETSLVATNRNIKPFANNSNSMQNNAKENVTEKQTQTETKSRETKSREVVYSSYGRGTMQRGTGERRTFQHPPRKDMRHGSGPLGGAANITKAMDRLTVHDSRDNRPPNREPRKEAKVAPTQHLATPQERRQAAVPPRMQDGAAASANRPKRYSSQRQRNVPESTSFQPSPPLQPQGPPMPSQYYDHGMEFQAVPETMAGYQPPIYTEAPVAPPPQQGPASQLLPPPPQSFQGFTTPYQETYAMRPIPSPPRLFAPVTMATGTIATGQPVMPAPYISASTNIMNYGPPPTNYQQYTFQQYPSPPPPQPASSQQEIFRGGMAYYNTHSQPHHMHVPVKRPKAAIPIIPPPELTEYISEDTNGGILIEEDEDDEDEDDDDDDDDDDVASLEENSNIATSHVAVEG